jgi:hypothetical protein
VYVTHFAPKEDMSYKNPTDPYNKVNPKNPCIRQLYEVVPTELAAEAKSEFTPEMRKRVRETVRIVDSFFYISDNKKKPHKDFLLLAAKCNVSLDLLYAIGWFRTYEHVHFNMLLNEEPSEIETS